MLSHSVYIIILNWNGWQDTIECVESILKLDYHNYCIVIVDNGSTDGSCDHILAWSAGELSAQSFSSMINEIEKPIRVFSYDRISAVKGGDPQTEKDLKRIPSGKRIAIIRNGENLGFAGGCNVGIRYALTVGAKYIWLLNNDTVVDPKALGNMVAFMGKHLDYQGVTGQIRLYDNPSILWNCGGKLTCYGARRYYHAGRPASKVPWQGFKKISFVTGCAPLFRASLFENVGLLSERFFFGEEDFEFSQRLKMKGYKIACLYNAVIYHKVGASTKEGSYRKKIAKIYIYYLNRFINMRFYWPKSIWKIWRFFYLFYILALLKVKFDCSLQFLWLFKKSLLKDSTKMNAIDRISFENILAHKFKK